MKSVFIVIATATLLTGAFGAIIKVDIRKLFSYLIVSHIGYMIAGLGLFTEVALAGALFYLIHDIMVKTNLFLISGLIYKIKGTVRMPDLGGMYVGYPKLSLLMAVILFSVVGVPPLSGFWPKILLFQSGFSQHSYVIIAAMLVASFVTLFVIAKMWVEVFWKEQPTVKTDHKDDFAKMNFFRKSLLVGPVVLLAIVTVYIGFGAENIMLVSAHIAKELIDPAVYIQAVLSSNAGQ
jgi:multicomponent Na+:H+ antiporter subunit D